MRFVSRPWCGGGGGCRRGERRGLMIGLDHDGSTPDVRHDRFRFGRTILLHILTSTYVIV